MPELRPAYPIATERMRLRPLTPADLDDVHAYQSRPDVCRWIPYEPRTREQVAANLADPERTRAALDAQGQALNLGMELDGRVIGDVMLFWRTAKHRGGELGYLVHPDFGGHGYATEGARAMLRLGFDELGLRRIVARIDAENEASARVLRRLGMRQEAHLRENEWFKGRWSDEIDFAILESEWRSGQGAGQVGDQVLDVFDTDR